MLRMKKGSITVLTVSTACHLQVLLRIFYILIVLLKIYFNQVFLFYYIFIGVGMGFNKVLFISRVRESRLVHTVAGAASQRRRSCTYT